MNANAYREEVARIVNLYVPKAIVEVWEEQGDPHIAILGIERAVVGPVFFDPDKIPPDVLAEQIWRLLIDERGNN